MKMKGIPLSIQYYVLDNKQYKKIVQNGGSMVRLDQLQFVTSLIYTV